MVSVEPTEEQFLQSVLELARWCGWQAYHARDSRRSPAGFLDLVLAKPDEPVIFAELKVGRRRLTAAQRAWAAVLQAARGTEVYLWYPRDFPVIAARLQRGRG